MIPDLPILMIREPPVAFLCDPAYNEKSIMDEKRVPWMRKPPVWKRIPAVLALMMMLSPVLPAAGEEIIMPTCT